mgnify:CR=1 FL=1
MCIIDSIMHPIAVQEITKRHYPKNFAAQILALLHDAIEDGPSAELSEAELRQMIRGSITDPRDLEQIEIALDFLSPPQLLMISKVILFYLLRFSRSSQ